VLIDGGRLVKNFDPYDSLYFGMADEPIRKGIFLALSNAPGHSSNGSNEQASIFSSRLAQRLISDSSDHKQFFKDFQTFCANQTQNRQIPWIRDGIAQSVSLSASSYQPLNHVTKEVKPESIVWKKAQGKSAVIFVDWTKLYAEPRVDAKILREIQSMFHVEKIAKGTSISISEMNGRPVWYRFKPANNKYIWHYAYHGVKLK